MTPLRWSGAGDCGDIGALRRRRPGGDRLVGPRCWCRKRRSRERWATRTWSDGRRSERICGPLFFDLKCRRPSRQSTPRSAAAASERRAGFGPPPIGVPPLPAARPSSARGALLRCYGQPARGGAARRGARPKVSDSPVRELRDCASLRVPALSRPIFYWLRPPRNRMHWVWIGLPALLEAGTSIWMQYYRRKFGRLALRAPREAA